jgi:hypothetical protein
MRGAGGRGVRRRRRCRGTGGWWGDVKGGEEPLAGREVGAVEHAGQNGGVEPAQVLGDEFVLAGEVLVGRALGRLGRRAKLVHAGAVDALLAEQLLGRAEDALAGAPAAAAAPGALLQLRHGSLDPLVPPSRVLPRHLLDQRRDLGVDARAPSPGRIGPPPADQPPVPAQQRARRNQPSRPQRPGKQPPGRRAPRGLPSPASAGGSAAAAPRPRGAAPAARRPSTPPSAPAAPSSPSGGRTSSRTSALPQARDAASPTTNIAGEPAVQRLIYPFGNPTGKLSRSPRWRPPQSRGIGEACSPSRIRSYKQCVC